MMAEVSEVFEEMRTLACVAGQSSVEGHDRVMSQADAKFAEYCTRWADALQRAVTATAPDYEQVDISTRLRGLNEHWRERSEADLQGTLSMLAHLIWHKRSRPGDHVWSIPVDFERDWDCILGDAVAELIERRRQSALLAAIPRPEVWPQRHPSTCASHLCGREWRTEDGAGVCRQPRDSEIHYVGTVDSHEFIPRLCDCDTSRTEAKGARANSDAADPAR
jgi:hypothetical protein